MSFTGRLLFSFMEIQGRLFQAKDPSILDREREILNPRR